MLFDIHINISRLQDDSDDADKEDYVDDLSLQGVQANIQPASPEFTAISDGAFGKTSVCFVSRSGIQDGDQVSVSGSTTTYIVKGTEDWQQPPIPHTRLVLNEKED